MQHLITMGLAFVLSMGSAFVPIVPFEIFLVGLGTHGISPWFGTVVVVCGGLGQMCGKLVFFFAGRGVRSRLSTRAKVTAEVEVAEHKGSSGRFAAIFEHAREHRGIAGAVTFVSGVIGIPPFAVTSVLAGAWRMSVVEFFVLGFCGRSIRFAVVLVAPDLVRSIPGL